MSEVSGYAENIIEEINSLPERVDFSAEHLSPGITGVKKCHFSISSGAP